VDLGDRFGGPGNPFRPGGFNTPTYKNVDLRLRKEFPGLGRTRLAVTADLFNAFNWWSYNYNNSGGVTSAANDPRRFQIGTEVAF